MWYFGQLCMIRQRYFRRPNKHIKFCPVENAWMEACTTVSFHFYWRDTILLWVVAASSTLEAWLTFDGWSVLILVMDLRSSVGRSWWLSSLCFGDWSTVETGGSIDSSTVMMRYKEQPHSKTLTTSFLPISSKHCMKSTEIIIKNDQNVIRKASFCIKNYQFCWQNFAPTSSNSLAVWLDLFLDESNLGSLSTNPSLTARRHQSLPIGSNRIQHLTNKLPSQCWNRTYVKFCTRLEHWLNLRMKNSQYKVMNMKERNIST